MRKKFVFIFVVIMLLLPLGTVFTGFAQEEPPAMENEADDLVIVSNPSLDIELVQSGQSYPSKTFPVTLTINSRINSNKVTVEWLYNEGIYDISGDKIDTVSVSQNSPTVVTKFFTPKFEDAGRFSRFDSFGVIVNAFLAGENYLSSSRIGVNFDIDMQIMPQSDQFQQEKRNFTIRRIGIIISSVLVVLSAIVFGVFKFYKYVTTDEIT